MIQHVQCETTSVCNAHCVFCPHDRFVHQGHMEAELYEKIVRDAAQYDLITFTAMLTGEPFCDPDIMDRLREARRLLKPETIIRIFTNGGLMTRDHIDQIAAIENVSVVLSLNAAWPQTRKRLMGLDDFDEVRRNAYYMLSKGIRTQLTMVWHPTVKVREVEEFVKLPNATVIQFQSFAGQMYPYRRHKGTCRRVMDYLTIQRDGTVCLCCFDAFGDIVFGNMRSQTIAEVLEGPERQMYVKANDTGRLNELLLCSECTEAEE